jgi:hypothetical protein
VRVSQVVEQARAAFDFKSRSLTTINHFALQLPRSFAHRERANHSGLYGRSICISRFRFHLQKMRAQFILRRRLAVDRQLLWPASPSLDGEGDVVPESTLAFRAREIHMMRVKPHSLEGD